MIEFINTRAKSAEEQEELFNALVIKALETKEHTHFEYIKNTAEWAAMRACKSGLNIVVELFESVATSLYNKYCQQVEQGNCDFNMLYCYTQYLECKKFYIQELEIIKSMLAEYWAYVKKGHFLTQFIYGQDRETWHLWDHRKEGPNG